MESVKACYCIRNVLKSSSLNSRDRVMLVEA